MVELVVARVGKRDSGSAGGDIDIEEVVASANRDGDYCRSDLTPGEASINTSSIHVWRGSSQRRQTYRRTFAVVLCGAALATAGSSIAQASTTPPDDSSASESSAPADAAPSTVTPLEITDTSVEGLPEDLTAGTPAASTDTGGALATSSAPASSEPDLPRIVLPVEPGSTVEGLVEVDGHDLYARCAGDGSPTVVYFTGWAGDPGDPPKLATDIAVGIENALGLSFRVCSYDRRNIGRSETVEGTQTPRDIIADVDGVLAALGEDGPFVLLGASFGGLVASTYAVAHPDRVAGVVLLDASTGVDYELDEMSGFQGACLPTNREIDANESLERIDNCRLAKWIHDRRDREPDVPLLFLSLIHI